MNNAKKINPEQYVKKHGGVLYWDKKRNKCVYSIVLEGREGWPFHCRNWAETKEEAIIKHPNFSPDGLVWKR